MRGLRHRVSGGGPLLGRSLGPLLGAALAWGCGSRTEPSSDPVIDGREGSPCLGQDDCDHSDLCRALTCEAEVCVALNPVVCTSDDPCADSVCEPATGSCVAAPKTRDADRDGHRSPLPGYHPGEPGSCGDDCDDTRAAAYPGGTETCDGSDNDCDGVIDNGSIFLGPSLPSVRLVAASNHVSSARRSLIYGDGSFFAGYWAQEVEDEPHGYLGGFTPWGGRTLAEWPVTQAQAPSFGPSLAWNGDAMAAVWTDARVDDNYEVFFSSFSARGDKLIADVRVTTAPDFSLHPEILFDQGRYVVAFDDRREKVVGVYGQLLDLQGAPLGEQLLLSGFSKAAEYPALAATPTSLGLVYTVLHGDAVGLELQLLDKQLGALGPPILVTDSEVHAPAVTAVGDSFLVTWDVYRDDGPGDAILGAMYDGGGNLLAGPVELASGAAYARSHSLVSFGDRVLMVWADTYDGNYELYAKVLGIDLTEREPRHRLTDDPAVTIAPYAALSDQGAIGVVFDDWRLGQHNAYMLEFGCVPSPSPPLL